MKVLLRRPVLAAALLGAVLGLECGIRTEVPLGFLDVHRAGVLAARGEAALIYDARARAEAKAYGDREHFPERSFRYPPSLAALAAPLGLLSPRVAWGIGAVILGAWAAAGVAAAAALAAARLPGGAGGWKGDGRWIPWAAVVPFVPFLAGALGGGFPVVGVFAFATLGLLAIDRGRDRIGGVLLGLAAAVKIFPALLIAWALWKRRWAAAAWGAGAAAVLFLALPGAVLGPGTTVDLLGAWAERGSDVFVTEYDEDPAWQISGRAQAFEGQSIQPVLTRWLAKAPYARVRELPGALQDGRAAWVNGGREWGPGTIRILVGILTFAALAVAVVATAPPADGAVEDRAGRGALEAGLALALLFVLWPEARWTHFAFLAPASAALAVRLAAPGPRNAGWTARAAALGAACLIALLCSDALVGRGVADAVLARGGGLLAGLLLLGACASALMSGRGAAAPTAPEPAAVEAAS
ncbi:MAG TPA: glycosyltransferase family 87 protein [Planctomycetota bacterium]|nr:glycosyltransferase family 87 protein [Planctomycetota bacterium]